MLLQAHQQVSTEHIYNQGINAKVKENGFILLITFLSREGIEIRKIVMESASIKNKFQDAGYLYKKRTRHVRKYQTAEAYITLCKGPCSCEQLSKRNLISSPFNR